MEAPVNKYEVQCIVSPPNHPESILSEASRILSGDRQADYGDAVENFKNIAKEVSRWCGKELSALDCVNVMIAVKTCRERFKPKRDNRVDLVAYHMIRDLILKDMEDGE